MDTNFDGIDDADLLPIQIGDYLYTLWYGESYLAPIIIFSRESTLRPEEDSSFIAEGTNLTEEGEITLNWNEFVNFTTTELESLFQQKNINWTASDRTFFESVRAHSTAISGIEFGVEPQTNNAEDLPYELLIKNLSIKVNGKEFGLTEKTNPRGVFTYPTNGDSLSPDDSVDITGNVSDDLSGVQRILIRIDRLSTEPDSYWNGSAWQNDSIWLSPSFDSNGDWSIDDVDLSSVGSYRMYINVRDIAGNVSRTFENPIPLFSVNQ
jgi:hypothetical protein